MKVTLFMAMSLNGMIADKEGGEDFLSHVNWNSFLEKANECGNFIVGRKTYQAVKEWGEAYGFDQLTQLDRVIISQQSELQIPDDYMVVNSPHDALDRLSKRGRDHILVTGGAATNSAFMKDALIDEVVLNIQPTILGEGIPLFAPDYLQAELLHTETRELSEGILQVTYLVQK